MSRRSKFVCLMSCAQSLGISIVLSVFFIIQVGCSVTASAQGAAGRQINSKVGVIYSDDWNNLLLDIPDSNLVEGTEVVVITMPGKSLSCCAEVGQVSSPYTKSVRQVIFDEDKTATYLLKLRGNNSAKERLSSGAWIGFGIIDSPDLFSSEGGEIRADLDGDGVQETFRDCTSYEGVHLTIWSGPPLEGRRLWHAYFYLGFETEPSCEERDFK